MKRNVTNLVQLLVLDLNLLHLLGLLLLGIIVLYLLDLVVGLGNIILILNLLQIRKHVRSAQQKQQIQKARVPSRPPW